MSDHSVARLSRSRSDAALCTRVAALGGLLVIVLLAGGCVRQSSATELPAPRAKLSAALGGRDEGIPRIEVVSPADGATVTSPVAMGVRFEHLMPGPAGATIDGVGHLHVVVDGECLKPGVPIPQDEHHLHFGDGSANIEVDLEPGDYEVCVQVGDGFHAAVAVTDSLAFTVVE